MLNRRELLSLVGAPGLTMTAGAASAASAIDKVTRIGVVGVGGRGTSLLRVLTKLPGVEIPAICDINEANLNRAQDIVEKTGGKRPEGYWRGRDDFRRLVARDDLDAVLTATPWDSHARICVAAMKEGKYAATEVPAATTVEDCWELVNTSEKTGMPLMMLENYCWMRPVMLALNIAEKGLFGELEHCEVGYQHDVRFHRFDHPWHLEEAANRNGSIYSTHAIGPAAWWLKINRGDRFNYLTSMSCSSQGMNIYLARRLGPDHLKARRSYALGDVNTTLIKTSNGATATIYYDSQTPRPLDLILRLQGTKGIYSGAQGQIYVEGRSPKLDEWESVETYYRQYEHPVWRHMGRAATEHGHGGSDYLELYAFVQSVRHKTQPPIDVYDAATWSVIAPLSEKSVASKSASVDVPDFTRGKWKSTRDLALGIP